MVVMAAGVWHHGSWANYGVSIARILQKIDHIIMAPHCIFFRGCIQCSMKIQLSLVIPQFNTLITLSYASSKSDIWSIWYQKQKQVYVFDKAAAKWSITYQTSRIFEKGHWKDERGSVHWHKMPQVIWVNTSQLQCGTSDPLSPKLVTLLGCLDGIYVQMLRADSRLAPSQWETSLQSNAVSHWLGTNLKSAMYAAVIWK